MEQGGRREERRMGEELEEGGRLEGETGGFYKRRITEARRLTRTGGQPKPEADIPSTTLQL